MKTIVEIALGIVTSVGGFLEIGSKLATGVKFQWWTIPAALMIWLVMWKGTFGIIEKGVSMLGLVTLCFVIGAYLLHPPASQVLRGALPSLPQHDSAHYWFVAVSILGATISPYLYFFNSSGGLNEVRADVEAEKTPALEWELWLRKKVIGRIPGA